MVVVGVALLVWALVRYRSVHIEIVEARFEPVPLPSRGGHRGHRDGRGKRYLADAELMTREHP